jgi:DNA-directed RNA polymerase subunit beta'
MTTLIPKSSKKTVEYMNKTIDKKGLKNLLSHIYLEFGGAKTAFLANTLKNLGYRYATKAGTTISIADLDVPAAKKDLLKEAEDQIERATQRYLKGEITEVERYTKVIDTWSETTAKLTDCVVQNFDRLNPVYMMAFSGARGNVSQVSQLVGMRGLMADSQGQIIDLPIKSNFKEGLSVTEYIISSYGARKGLVDTALKTADSGYLTRRLVDVAQDVIIKDHDCGTKKYIEMTSISDGEKAVVPLIDRLLGRTIAEDIKDEKGNVVVPAHTLMDREQIGKIKGLNIEKIKVRSGLTCELEYGVCQKCYGWALTTNKQVDIGEAIGIIAAQSIGEPGTQLTMRTFHTGGVFRGSGSMRQIIAEFDGKITSKVMIREQRTRHGDVVNVAVKEEDVKVESSKGKTTTYHIPHGATVFFAQGDEFKKGNVLFEFEPTSQGAAGRLTEKATKDITADIPGEIQFDNFTVDEKRDRQGNISRTANRNGIVWVLGGDVYNLPTGSKVLVKDEATVKAGTVLAETTTVSEHGGEVRLGEELVIEEAGKIKKIVNGKELTIVIASIKPDNAVLEKTSKELLWHVESTGEKYIIKSPQGITVENGMIVAELIDEENVVTSSGEVRYEGIEVDEHQIITKPGKILFIPEETHQISKDASLKMVESGAYVTAGTEVVKDVYTHIDGIVEIKEFNDIIHEVVIRSGEIHDLESVNNLKVEDGEIVAKGTEIADGIKVKEKSLITVLYPEAGHDSFSLDDLDDEEFSEEETTTTEDETSEESEIKDVPVQVLVRPVQEFDIAPREVSIDFSSTENDLIDIVPVTQLQYKDGSVIRNLEGAALTRTSLVLQMQGYVSHLKGLVEDHEDNLRIVVLENLIVRRETENVAQGNILQTELLVENGEVIDPKTPVSKTQVLAQKEAIVSLPQGETENVRRLILISDAHNEEVALSSKPIVKAGELVKIDQVITESGETSKVAGLVVDTKAKSITVRVGRPYLISAGTMLQIEEHGLVQRGDLLATLVFERQKTGDIVQGLPRVEELLEGRRPKECAILAEEDGVAEIQYDEGTPTLYLATENGRYEIKFPIDSNIIVADKQAIKKGQALTSGPLNPHDIIRLCGKEAVQQYLVDEVQRVYRSQGVEIADKHIEIIVRQMTKKVKVVDSGDTKLLPGELVEQYMVEAENAEVEKIEGTPATFENVLLGITKASLNTESFISAASFQETTRILTEVAVEGKKDVLRGLKENVIIGRLIPAGTGHYHLTHADEEAELQQQRAAKSSARKPSAILEEIEGMFGAPEFEAEDFEAMSSQIIQDDLSDMENVPEESDEQE